MSTALDFIHFLAPHLHQSRQSLHLGLQQLLLVFKQLLVDGVLLRCEVRLIKISSLEKGGGGSSHSVIRRSLRGECFPTAQYSGHGVVQWSWCSTVVIVQYRGHGAVQRRSKLLRRVLPMSPPRPTKEDEGQGVGGRQHPTGHLEPIQSSTEGGRR